MKNAVVSMSGGIDSTVVVSKLLNDGWNLHLLHFLYGCHAQNREVESVSKIADTFGLGITVLCMRNYVSSLLHDGEPTDPELHGKGKEWVPGRNFCMIAMAVAFAESNGYQAVALGTNREAAIAYPDNSEEFISSLNDLMKYVVVPGYSMELLNPIGHMMKNEIVSLGIELCAPLEHTWSCYRDSKIHCGRCSSCSTRRSAFESNNFIDPVEMESV